MSIDPTDPTTWPASACAHFERREAGRPPAPLLALLRERIRAHGPVTFAGFMDAALYHPDHGYYTNPVSPVGRTGDFVTAPEHHPAFGQLLGRRVEQIARELGEPADLTVVEMGAGSGALAAGILTQLQGAPFRYRIVEPLAVWRQRQEERLAPHARRVEWVESLEACAPFTGVFLSNELPDAFPVHRVVFRSDELRELWVTVDGDRLMEAEGKPSTPELAAYFERLGFHPPEGCAVEVNLKLAPWARQAAERIRRGSFLTIDYGGTAEELYREGRSRLRAYRLQSAAADPLAEPGRQDLTADVDFTTLIQACEEAGMTLHAFTTQRDFLLAMGWREWLRAGAPGGRRALTDLIDPLLMGRTRVLEMVRR